METHHWSRVQVAHLRPEQEDFERVRLGRRRIHTDFNKLKSLAGNFETTNALPQPTDEVITQPRFTSNRTNRQAPAAGAEFGSETIVNPPSRRALNDLVPRVTGAPPHQPFPSKQTSHSSLAPDQVDPGLELGRELLPPEVSSRLAPPVTKGAHQNHLPAPSAGPDNSIPTPSVETQAGHLRDHDYFRRPSAILDHDYFQPTTAPSTPSAQGRPARSVRLPEKFKDYDLN